MKRIFDILVSILVLLFLSPFLLLTSILVKLTSPGPVFYRAMRVGKGGVPFRLYKFRSMTVAADQRGPKITAQGDSRITPLGRWLRRLKIDELPQFINVLKGEMSIVGPRPEDPHYVKAYTPEQKRVLDLRPGITSPASVRFRHEEQLLSGADWERQYLDDVLPHKLQIELDYLHRRTFFTDLKIIWDTIVALFK
jgi:lipopolysaccharide/colanic/teichoic acid biosynthesis glycosyltransferase